MKIKLDENLSRHLKTILNNTGHDALTAADEGLLSQPDEVIAEAAKNEERIVFTLDVEFANAKKYPPGTHPGIVLFRPAGLGPLEVNTFIQRFVTDEKLEGFTGCLVVVEPGRIRIRRPESEV